jgi:hypothetical protein
MTTEQQWIQSFIKRLDEEVKNISHYLKAVNGQKLPYAYEIAQYRDEEIDEWQNLMELINLEYKASKDTEEFLFSSRKPGRKHYTVMHKQLKLI